MPTLSDAVEEAARLRRTLVFPSEVAAEFWRRETLRRGAAEAVREDRFLSWDRCKERLFAQASDRAPANRVVRSVFAADLLDENGAAPFLSTLLPPFADRHSTAYARMIVESLAGMPAVDRLSAGGALISPTLVTDLMAVRARYRAFLDEHGLYEPAWTSAQAVDAGGYALVLPHLAADFTEFDDALTGAERVGGPSSGDRPLPPFVMYADARRELDETLAAVAALLDGGAAPEQIVITAAGLDRIDLRLREAAAVVGVPLTIRFGVPLLDSAPGRLFASVREAVGSGFGLESVKRLLLNRAIPWRDYPANLDLVTRGARSGCIGGTSRPDPRWRRVGGSRPLLDALLRTLPRITGARDAGALRAAVLAFTGELLEREAWRDDDERVLERCLAELAELAAIETAHGVTIRSPLAFWLARLGEELYVPRRRERGVTVLPYRVGAGICPAHHFVVNAGSAAVRVRHTSFPFLSEAQRDSLDVPCDRDLTDAFLRAYAESGREVRFSASEVTFDGPGLAPGLFVTASAVVRADSAGVPTAASVLRSEESFSQPPPERLLGVQADGAAAYARVAGRRGVDLTRQPIEDPRLRDAVLQARRRDGGLPSLSVTDLDAFRACPFSYLFSRVLGLEELELSVDPDNPRDAGLLYHRVLEWFYRAMQESGERFDPVRTDRYREQLDELLERAIRSSGGMAGEPVLRANEELYRRVFTRVLRNDAALIAGHRPEFVEGWEQQLDPVGGVHLVARVDRVTRAPDGSLTIVDYKKRTVPARSAQYGASPEATGIGLRSEHERAQECARITSIQIPFYVWLIESSGERVAAAAYYSLEDGEPLIVASETAADDAVMTRERLREVTLLVGDMTRDMVARLAAGDYSCAACDGCALRAVCRTRFVVR